MFGGMYTKIIRIYVGEIIRDKYGVGWLISGKDITDSYTYINLQTGFIERSGWGEFKLRNYPIEQEGKLNGIELLEGEDWLCHDERCYPGVLAGGCSGCMYSRLVKERKRYFEPGDIVWIPSEKKERIIIESALFYQREKGGTPIKLDNIYGKLHDLDHFIWSVRFKTEKYPINEYYRWDEIRLVKRNRHFINPTQLSHICNDLCLFGPYSKTNGIKCWDCKTGVIWRQIR